MVVQDQRPDVITEGLQVGRWDDLGWFGHGGG